MEAVEAEHLLRLRHEERSDRTAQRHRAGAAADDIAAQTGVRVITHPGRCEVHERFRATDITVEANLQLRGRYESPMNGLKMMRAEDRPLARAVRT